MASACGLVIIKEFTYRDNPTEQWSNKYWLTGTPPTSSSAWKTLFDDVVSYERTCYDTECKVVGGYAYDDNTPGANSVWSIDLKLTGSEVPGTLAHVEGTSFAGDQAGLLSFKTERKNSRGKWIYLRKFFHAGNVSTANSDYIDGPTSTAYEAFGLVLFSGSWTNGRRIRSQKQDETLQSHAAHPYVTTRTLKRRGRRP